jgi:hypothetical protein
LEIFVVCVNGDWVVGSKKVRSTTFKTVDNAKHFFVVDIIVLFSGEERSRVESNGILSVGEVLADYYTEGKV